MKKLKILAVLLAVLAPNYASAAEVIGITKGPAAENYESPENIEAQDDHPPVQLPKNTKRAGVNRAQIDAMETDSSGGADPDFSLHSSVGLLCGFCAEAALSASFNRFFSMDFGGSFTRSESGNDLNIHYGPEVDAVLRYPNRSIITPFVGVGTGYVKWHRERAAVDFDSGSSMTGSYFGGASLALTRYLGLKLMVKSETYLIDKPRSFVHPDEHEEATQQRVDIGFFISI